MLRLKNGVKSVTAEKQMLLKEVKLSKARRKHAEQESERWKAVSEGKHKRHSLKSMLVNLSSRMDVFPVARVGQHSSTGSSQIAKESDSFPHFADKYLPQRTEGLCKIEFSKHVFLFILSLITVHQDGVNSTLSTNSRISPPQHCKITDCRLPLFPPPCCSNCAQVVCVVFALAQQPRPATRSICFRKTVFPVAPSQDERILSEGHPSCTPPDKNSLMECDLVEPLGCDMSTVVVVSSDQPQNISGDVLVGVEKSNQNSNDVGVDDILGPSKVTTKGRPKSKRLGTTLEKSFKNSCRRKQKNSSPIDVVRLHTSQDINHGAVAGLNVLEQAGFEAAVAKVHIILNNQSKNDSQEVVVLVYSGGDES
ncbi:hypothetical protein AHAS_Ahas02G0069800 [Arachis hypogaea]